MKYNLEILSSEKFWINFLIDLLLSIKISLKKYWYILIAINVAAIYAANYHYKLQGKLYYLSSTIKLGTLSSPRFGSGVIVLPPLTGSTRIKDKLKENFGLSKKDFLSEVSSRFLGASSFKSRSTGKKYNIITSFGFSASSSFVSIQGEGTDAKKLEEKYRKLMTFLSDSFNKTKSVIKEPLVSRKKILLEEKKQLDKEYNDLVEIEKEFGYTKEVEEKKDEFRKRLIEIRKQLLDFERSQKAPYMIDLKVVSVHISKKSVLPYSRKTFLLIYVGIGIGLQILAMVVFIYFSFKEIPPNLYLLKQEA